jgi:hypothetical protein
MDGSYPGSHGLQMQFAIDRFGSDRESHSNLNELGGLPRGFLTLNLCKSAQFQRKYEIEHRDGTTALNCVFDSSQRPCITAEQVWNIGSNSTTGSTSFEGGPLLAWP